MTRPEMVFLITLVLAPLSCWAQTSDFWGMNREELLPFAEQGIADAQYRLGRDYHVSGQDDRYTQAEKWYRLAADQGHPEAQFNLGLMYRRGQILSSAESSRHDQLFGVISRQPPSDVDHSAAFNWFKIAADQGHVDAQALLGQSYELGLGTDQDYEKAMKWYFRASDNGDDYSRYALGAMYEDGRGVAQDFEEAATWYQLGFRYPEALFRLAFRK